jgi:hypothetical protein
MKFGDKYELVESLTTGPVETFVAKDIRRGESVLVHILECGERKPNQPTVQWVMDAFRSLAPEPAGLVLEAGGYSGTLYAYLVTQLPEADALRRWVERYKLQMQETQEVAAPLPPSKVDGDSPTAEVSSVELAPPPGTFTQAFMGFGLQSNLGSEPNHAKPAMSSEARPLPSNPPSAAIPGPRIEPYREPAGRMQPVPAPAAANSFPTDFKATDIPADEIGPVVRENSPKPGEFTSFFRGPFAEGRPSDIAAPLPQPPPPQRKVVGEFTATFGSPANWRDDQAMGSGGSGPGGLNEAPGEFTRTFDLDRPSKAADNFESHIPAGPGPLSGMFETVKNPARDSFLSPSVPIPPAPIIPQIPAIPERMSAPLAVEPIAPSAQNASQGATQLFRMPGAQAEVSEPPLPSGPGEYTRIISIRPPEALPTDEETAQDSKSGVVIPVASLPKFPAPPPLPPAPKLAPPKVAPPKLAAPKLAPPKLAPPKIEPPKNVKSPMSYWPLILTLTVLFFVAALLVVYFALKH